MNKQEEQLNALNDIRNMMDRSSRFISLSGLSGVFAGATGLVGAYLAKIELDAYLKGDYGFGLDAVSDIEFKLLQIGLMVLIVAIAGGLVFTLRRTKKKGLPFWSKTAKSLLFNLALPLATGGLFVLALLFSHPYSSTLIAPSCLIFYGLALVNASKYTYTDIRFLGICEIILGLICIFYVGYGLYFWAFGFGVLHILYGLIMYFKYERAK